jgi:hypothetical protein
MLAKTAILKTNLRKAASLAESVKILNRFYDGETLYVIACGPSLNRLDKNQLVRKLKGRFVMTIKQAYDLFPDQSDFHVYNNFNHQKYHYLCDDSPIRIFGCDSNCPQILGPRPDIQFSIDPSFEKPDNAPDNKLMYSLDFDRYLLFRTLIRPCGYGIMYEIVFYLAIHLGVRQCVVIGWDLAATEGDYERFYRCREMPVVLHKAISATRFLVGRHKAEWFRTQAKYHLGYVYNEQGALPGEMAPLIASTKYAFEWLKSHGVDLSVISSISCVDPVIPRINLADL